MLDMALFSGEVSKVKMVFCPGGMCPPDGGDCIQQKLSINANGRVDYTSMEYYSPIEITQSGGRWEKRSIGPEEAAELLSAIAAPFRVTHDTLVACDAAMWELSITNTEGKTYEYKGFAIPGCFEGAEELSYKIRTELLLPDFGAFDDCECLRIRQPGDLLFCDVQMISTATGRCYWYISDDESLGIGDVVVVPFGSENKEELGEIVDTIYCPIDDTPFPVGRTKKIIRRHQGDATSEMSTPSAEQSIEGEKADTATRRKFDWHGVRGSNLRLRLNIDEVDMMLKVKDWKRPTEPTDWDDCWTDLDFSLTGKYINAPRTGEVFTSSEIVWLCDQLGALLDGKLEHDTDVDFIEPDFAFSLSPSRTIKKGEYPEQKMVVCRDMFCDISVTMKINFWCTDGLGSNQFSMTLNREEIDIFHTYLQTVIGTIPPDDSKVLDLLNRGLFLPE